MTQTQLLEAILQDNSFKSIDQSESLEDFLGARQNDLDESEISEQYRVMENQAQRWEADAKPLFLEMGSEERAGNTIYEDQEICSSSFFYRQGFFEGVKCLLIEIASLRPDQTCSPVATQLDSDAIFGKTLSRWVVAALKNYNLLSSVRESDTLDAFITARTKNFQIIEISGEYKTLQAKRTRYEECLQKLLREAPEEQEKVQFPEYAEMEARSNRLFYRRGLYEGAKLILTVIANILPDTDYSIGDKSFNF